MSKVQPRTLSGFMELMPARQIQFDRMMAVLRESYSLYGFTPLDTPIIEASEVLLAKGGGETEKQIYRFQKGDSDLSLRFDLTVPLAKYVAQYSGQLAFPFRRFQIGKVYRGERAQRGRFREFYQADIDIIGDGKLDISNDAEIPAIIYRTFTSLGLKRFQIRVNNRKILNGFYAMLDLTHESGAIMRTVDKLDKIGAAQVKELLMAEESGLSAEQAGEIMRFIAIDGSNAEVLQALDDVIDEDRRDYYEEIFHDLVLFSDFVEQNQDVYKRQVHDRVLSLPSMYSWVPLRMYFSATSAEFLQATMLCHSVFSRSSPLRSR